MGKNLTLNILFPVLNEEIRLEKGIRETARYLSGETKIDYVLTIIDNGSTDRTEEIARKLCAEDPAHVRYIRIETKGVGVAFRAGVAANRSDIVGYMDVDLSTDLQHVSQMYDAFCSDGSVDMINASRWNELSDTSGRKFYRNITSAGLMALLRLAFKMQATDAICGFKFYRKEAAEKLIEEAGPSSDSWFYIIELLVRAERGGMKIVELPVRWVDDPKNSTVRAVPLIWEYLKQILRLKHRLKEER